MSFTMNGIDAARADALEAAGIDPHGPMIQFKTVLDADYCYCNQHLNVHRTDASCTVDCFEKFPLYIRGDFDDALTEARQRGFRIYGEPAPCQHCGATIHQPQNSWVTLDGNESRCEKREPTMYGSGHQPVDNLPAIAIAVV